LEKKNSILAKASQVSDVPHGPLVINFIFFLNAFEEKKFFAEKESFLFSIFQKFY
jgi:hypothetical protein